MSDFSTLFSIFIIGLSYGTTACMFSCMPFLTPLLISNSNSTKEALGVIVPFSLGRVFSYTILSVIAYLSSFWVKKILDDTMITDSVLGGVTVIMGIFILYNSFKKTTVCINGKPLRKGGKGKLGLFTMGASMSLNPCAPIMALLAVAMNVTALYMAVGIGVSFGIGAVIFSILFYGLIFSTLIKGILIQFGRYKLWVERTVAFFLIIFGLSILNKNNLLQLVG